MISKADTIVIGSGGLGAATAYYLSKRGLNVVLIDKHDIGSQTSPRAAGRVSILTSSPDTNGLAASSGCKLASRAESILAPTILYS